MFVYDIEYFYSKLNGKWYCTFSYLLQLSWISPKTVCTAATILLAVACIAFG